MRDINAKVYAIMMLSDYAMDLTLTLVIVCSVGELICIHYYKYPFERSVGILRVPEVLKISFVLLTTRCFLLLLLSS